MTEDNRITGPGYYPRRPSPPPLLRAFRPIKSVELWSAAHLEGDIRWRGAGTYTFHNGPTWNAFARTHWIMRGDDEEELWRVECEPTIVEPGGSCTIVVNNTSVPVTTEMLYGGVWEFTARRT